VRHLPAYLLLAIAAACATVDATRSLLAAEVALEGARAAGAEKAAPYEYAAAEANYQKAREENGLARYGDAADHAQKAAALAREAQAKAAQGAPRPEAK